MVQTVAENCPDCGAGPCVKETVCKRAAQVPGDWPRDCEVVLGEFAWGVQRCDALGYAYVRHDGATLTVCHSHYVQWTLL